MGAEATSAAHWLLRYDALLRRRRSVASPSEYEPLEPPPAPGPPRLPGTPLALEIPGAARAPLTPFVFPSPSFSEKPPSVSWKVEIHTQPILLKRIKQRAPAPAPEPTPTDVAPPVDMETTEPTVMEFTEPTAIDLPEPTEPTAMDPVATEPPAIEWSIPILFEPSAPAPEVATEPPASAEATMPVQMLFTPTPANDTDPSVIGIWTTVAEPPRVPPTFVIHVTPAPATPAPPTPVEPPAVVTVLPDVEIAAKASVEPEASPASSPDPIPQPIEITAPKPALQLTPPPAPRAPLELTPPSPPPPAVDEEPKVAAVAPPPPDHAPRPLVDRTPVPNPWASEIRQPAPAEKEADPAPASKAEPTARWAGLARVGRAAAFGLIAVFAGVSLRGAATHSKKPAAPEPVASATATAATPVIASGGHSPAVVEGDLEVHAPQDVPVYVDGRMRGKGPSVTAKLAPGYHMVRVGAKQTQLVEIHASKTTTIDVAAAQ
jgi:hypothetical protein